MVVHMEHTILIFMFTSIFIEHNKWNRHSIKLSLNLTTFTLFTNANIIDKRTFVILS